VGLLWTMTDFIAKGLLNGPFEGKGTGSYSVVKPSVFNFLMFWNYTNVSISGVNSIVKQINNEKTEGGTHISNIVRDKASSIDGVDFEKLLFSVFSLLQNLGADERPEVQYFKFLIWFHFEIFYFFFFFIPKRLHEKHLMC